MRLTAMIRFVRADERLRLPKATDPGMRGGVSARRMLGPEGQVFMAAPAKLGKA